jgi:hypothetical protein
MLVGSSRPNRQNGRYNESKDRKSNRKPVRQPKTDKQEAEEIKVDIVGAEVSSLELLKNIETPIVQPPTDYQRYLKNKLSVDKEAMAAHDRVALERPGKEPSWHQKQMAFEPSKSYTGKTRSDNDQKKQRVEHVSDDGRRPSNSD